MTLPDPSPDPKAPTCPSDVTDYLSQLASCFTCRKRSGQGGGGLREKLGSSSAPETERVVWWGAEVTAEWWVGTVCLGSQRSAFLDMVERLLFQE